MSTPKWEPGKLYPPGSLVVPRAEGGVTQSQLTNPGFDTDASGWNLTAGTGGTIGWAATGGYQSPGCIHYTSPGGPLSDGQVECATDYPVIPGQRIDASAMFQLYAGPNGFGGSLYCNWLDAGGTIIQTTLPPESQVLRRGKGGGWRKQSVTFIAPAGAAKIRLKAYFDTTEAGGGSGRLDNVSWSYVPPVATTGLMYRATQAAAGYSATTEPSWPPTVGVPVVDNEVTWEGVTMSRIVWRAEPILVSGATEPTWPGSIGESVVDNTISWTAKDPATSDANCPQSKIVAIAKFKVYAGDGDVVRYTATLNPQDWSSEKDAGYLGTGLQQNGANRVALLNLYRANLVVMNATTFQQWQIDPDPSLMDLLDTMDGIGSIWHLAAQPVSNDLFYLSNRGVRTIGMSGTTNNLKAGDVGLPVDEMVRELVAELVDRNRSNGNENQQPLGLYLPSMGQYWLAFNRRTKGDESDIAPGGPVDVCPQLNGGPESEVGDPYCEVMVYTLTQVGQVGAWSRYIFPFPIDAWAQEGDDLYARDGDTVYRISEDIGCRDRWNGADEGEGYWERFDAIIQWPWLDMGPPGIDKQMEDFDVVGYGGVEVEVGYDQTEPGYFTEPYPVVADTLRGTTIPMPLTSPSYSVRLRYRGLGYGDGDDGGSFAPSSDRVYNETWGFNAMRINFT